MRKKQSTNNLTLVVYSSGINPLNDIPGDARRISQLRFSTGYPAGLYIDASFVVQRHLGDYWQMQIGKRLHIFLDAITPVWEGIIMSLDYNTDESGGGIIVVCVGQWAWIAMRRMLKKQWCDTSVGEESWKQSETYAEKFDVDRQDIGFRIVCKHGDFTNPDNMNLYYTAPTGQYLKRVTYDYNFVEDASSTFKAALFEDTGSGYTVIASSEVSATGTGTKDITLSANCTSVKLQLYPVSVTSTIADNQWTYVEFKKVAVYTETGTVDLTEVVKDIRAYISSINSSELFIQSMGALSRSLVGSPSSTYGDTNYPSNFGSEGEPLTAGDLMFRAASYGDVNNDLWAVGFLDSLQAYDYDGEPLLYCEKYPELTDYEYIINLSDQNLIPAVSIQQTAEDLSNYVYVTYTDPNGNDVVLSPEDDSSLKDQTSIDTYGQQDNNLNIGDASGALALSNGQRFLKRYKDARWVLSNPIKIKEKVYSKSGLPVSASRVRAGERVLVFQDNFGFTNQDATINVPGVIFLISSTEYDEESDSIVITAGPPPDLIWPIYVTPRQWDELDTTRKIGKIGSGDDKPGGHRRPVPENSIIIGRPGPGKPTGTWGRVYPQE